jgi:hypothetical protein
MLQLVALLAVAAAPPNAWTVWTAEPSPLSTPEALEPVRGLAPTIDYDADVLSALASIEPELAASLREVRAGLAMRRCEGNMEASVFAALERAQRGSALALVRASRGQPADDVVEDLFALGRRFARCSTSLLGFAAGKGIEEDAGALALWLARRGRIGDEAALRLGAIIRRAPLGRADLARALERELDFTLGLLLPEGSAPTALYSRADTERFLRERNAELVAAVRAGQRNLAPLKEPWENVLDEEEKLLMGRARGSIARRDAVGALVQLARGRDGQRPNFIGRLLLATVADGSIRVASRASRELWLQRMLPSQFERALAEGRDKPVAVSAPRAESASEVADMRGRCRPIGGGHYEVDATALEELGGDGFALLARQGRVIPAFVGGEAVGMKLLSVRPDSFLGSCGLRAGDVVRAINERELASPSAALASADLIRLDREARLWVERAGATLRFSIRAPPAKPKGKLR